MESSVLESHACLDNPIPKPETQPTLAYDRLQLPVLAGHLRHSDVAVVHAAATSLRRLVTTHDAAVKIHEAGLLEILSDKAKEQTPDVLEIARMCIECLRRCITSAGLRSVTMGNSAVVSALRKCMNSEDYNCREEAYTALEFAAEFHDTAKKVIDAGFVVDIVKRIAAENKAGAPSAKLLKKILAVFRRLLAHSDLATVDLSLAVGIVPVLFEVLKNDVPLDNKVIAAEDLLYINVAPTGKKATIGIPGGIEHLIHMLNEASSSLVGPLLGCLMGVAIEDEGKAQIVKLGGADAIARVLPRRDLPISSLLYACQLICNIACVPGAREVLSHETAVGSLHVFQNQRASASLSRAAGNALESINWTP